MRRRPCSPRPFLNDFNPKSGGESMREFGKGNTWALRGYCKFNSFHEMHHKRESDEEGAFRDGSYWVVSMDFR